MHFACRHLVCLIMISEMDEDDIGDYDDDNHEVKEDDGEEEEGGRCEVR